MCSVTKVRLHGNLPCLSEEKVEKKLEALLSAAELLRGSCCAAARLLLLLEEAELRRWQPWITPKL